MVEGLDSVIEKLTEKVAISAEALRPIATETLRQIQLRGAVEALLSCAAVLVAAGVFWGGMYIPRKMKLCDEDQSAALCVAGIIAVLLVIVGVAGIGSGLTRWLSPLPYALGM